MKKIEFTQNWNGKLCCDVWPSIRMYNPEKYVEDDLFEIFLKDQSLGIAKLLMRKPFQWEKFNDQMSFMESGHTPSYMKKVFHSMYGARLTGETWMYFLLFEYTERHNPGHANLFKHRWDKLAESIPNINSQELPLNS